MDATEAMFLAPVELSTSSLDRGSSVPMGTLKPSREGRRGVAGKGTHVR